MRTLFFRAGSVPLSTCRLCAMVPERADHILLSCPRLSTWRRECFRHTNVSADEPEWEVSHVAKFLGSETIRDLEADELEDEQDEAGRRGGTDSGSE